MVYLEVLIAAILGLQRVEFSEVLKYWALVHTIAILTDSSGYHYHHLKLSSDFGITWKNLNIFDSSISPFAAEGDTILPTLILDFSGRMIKD